MTDNTKKGFRIGGIIAIVIGAVAVRLGGGDPGAAWSIAGSASELIGVLTVLFNK